jgi:hypothetical protein
MISDRIYHKPFIQSSMIQLDGRVEYILCEMLLKRFECSALHHQVRKRYISQFCANVFTQWLERTDIMEWPLYCISQC